MQPIVVFDLDNTLVHSRIDFMGIRQAIIRRLLEVGALAEPPANPRVRAIPEWLDLAAAPTRPCRRAVGGGRPVRAGRHGPRHGRVRRARTLDRLVEAGFRLVTRSAARSAATTTPTARITRFLVPTGPTPTKGC